MQIKAIVLDLDRTLLRTDKTISEYTASVLRRCRERGLGVMAASARPMRTILPYCGAVHFDGITAGNGARIRCGSCCRDYAILTESAERLLTALSKDVSLRITLETGDAAYSNVAFEDFETVVTQDLVGVAKREGVLKILVGIDREGVLETVDGMLTDDLYRTVANGHLIQIMSRAATKWNGIQAMLAACGCTPAEAVYFGDDFDDAEPIKMCGLGVAVENAIPEVKEAADCVCESNDCDGVAKWLERNVL